MAAKKRKATLKPRQPEVTVEDFNWGSMFQGSKEALVAAGLVEPKCKLGKEYSLPLDWKKGWEEACFGPKFGPIPPRWDATFHRSLSGSTFAVSVKFDVLKDLNVRQRAERVIAHLNDLATLIAGIAPRPLSVQVAEAIRASSRRSSNE